MDEPEDKKRESESADNGTAVADPGFPRRDANP